MRLSEKLGTARVPKNVNHRVENIMIVMSVLGVLSMASIYLLFI